MAFRLVNGFIDHLYARLGTTSNYSVTANLHNSQITTAPGKPFSACCVFSGSSLATASNSGDSSASCLCCYCLANIATLLGCTDCLLFTALGTELSANYQLQNLTDPRQLAILSVITPWCGLRRQHSVSPIARITIAMGMCSPSHWLETGHTTILLNGRMTDE
jgi:hypothetical protein